MLKFTHMSYFHLLLQATLKFTGLLVLFAIYSDISLKISSVVNRMVGGAPNSRALVMRVEKLTGIYSSMLGNIFRTKGDIRKLYVHPGVFSDNVVLLTNTVNSLLTNNSIKRTLLSVGPERF